MLQIHYECCEMETNYFKEAESLTVTNSRENQIRCDFIDFLVSTWLSNQRSISYLQCPAAAVLAS